MNDSTPPEDGEPASFAEKTKSWYTKRKPQIHAIAGAAGALGAAALAIALLGPAEREDGERYEAEDAENPEAERSPPAAALTPEVREPRSRAEHQVKGALVDIGDRQASERAQENYRRDGGGELPPRKTYRPPHSRGSSPPDDFDLRA